LFYSKMFDLHLTTIIEYYRFVGWAFRVSLKIYMYCIQIFVILNFHTYFRRYRTVPETGPKSSIQYELIVGYP
jgi:hypothetical protein